jgi:two-component system, NtrC family, nitrogen regulation sensor histidine kinase NtrY
MPATSVMPLKNWDYQEVPCTGGCRPMVFKNFRLQVALRVILLLVATTLLSWCIVSELYLRSIYLAVGIGIIAIEFIAYADRFNRDIKTFMVSMMQRDFTTRFEVSGKGRSFDELYDVLNKISTLFKNISAEKEAQHRYLEMLVEHVRVGIISVDSEGKIHLANQTVKRLLQREILPSINAIRLVNDNLASIIELIRTGETRLVKLRSGNELQQLSVHASEFKLEGKYYKLISMTDIRNELDAQELEAWQKLIRVMSHEIMNSVAPIISLSSTLHGLVLQNRSLESANETYEQSLDKGLEAIKSRSEGLYNFTQSYKKLTGIPGLKTEEVSLKSLVERILPLMQTKSSQLGVKLYVSVADVMVVADPGLIEQVLINLIINAFEAIDTKADGEVAITSSINGQGSVCLHISDNGEGMDDIIAEKIFIPFFTTKKQGSGIGLALVKQILQMHRAGIQFRSEPGQGTTFSISF